MNAETARKTFSYDPETGVLKWNISYGKITKGQIAGTNRGNGYLRVGYNYRSYETTYIIWLIMTGREPSHIIDHKDKNKQNNRWNNLREATSSQNAANCSARTRNKTGIKGVFFDKARSKYLANIMKDGRTIFIGRYNSANEAEIAYKLKAKELFGEFAE